jgi:hypothetical protein
MIGNDVKNTTRSDLRGGNAGMKQTAKQAPTGENFSRDMRREMLKQLIVDRMSKKG